MKETKKKTKKKILKTNKKPASIRVSPRSRVAVIKRKSKPYYTGIEDEE